MLCYSRGLPGTVERGGEDRGGDLGLFPKISTPVEIAVEKPGFWGCLAQKT